MAISSHNHKKVDMLAAAGTNTNVAANSGNIPCTEGADNSPSQ